MNKHITLIAPLFLEFTVGEVQKNTSCKLIFTLGESLEKQ
jgi:hypothetical protein